MVTVIMDIILSCTAWYCTKRGDRKIIIMFKFWSHLEGHPTSWFNRWGMGYLFGVTLDHRNTKCHECNWHCSAHNRVRWVLLFTRLKIRVWISNHTHCLCGMQLLIHALMVEVSTWASNFITVLRGCDYLSMSWFPLLKEAQGCKFINWKSVALVSLNTLTT